MEQIGPICGAFHSAIPDMSNTSLVRSILIQIYSAKCIININNTSYNICNYCEDGLVKLGTHYIQDGQYGMQNNFQIVRDRTGQDRMRQDNTGHYME